MVFNIGPYTVLPDNSILITANMQLETGFPSSHQVKSYVASKSRLKLAACAVLSADAGLLVDKVTDKLSWLLFMVQCRQNLVHDVSIAWMLQHVLLDLNIRQCDVFFGHVARLSDDVFTHPRSRHC